MVVRRRITQPVLSDEEAARIAPVTVLPIHEWAERHRMITQGPLVGPGGRGVPWRNDVDPLGVAIMQALDSDRWSRVCLMGSPQQSSKTEIAINLALSIIQQQRQNVFYYNASSSAAQDVWRKKIAPAIKASETLCELLYDDREEGGTKDRRDFTNGASLFVRGSESRAALGQATAMVTIGDDLQSMCILPEGDHPADLAMERADAFPVEQRRHLHIGQSGMVDDYLSRELFDSTFYMPFVPCPECGTYQLIEWNRFVYAEGDPDAARRDCTMRCASEVCPCRIRDEHLPAMLTAHRWVSTPPKTNWLLEPMEGGTKVVLTESAVFPETERQTSVCGFARSAFYWPFASWGGFAVQAIEAVGNPEKEINFQKRICAVPYKPPEIDEEALHEEELEQHVVEGYEAGTVPDWADMVIGTIDVQSGYVYYLFRAWQKSTGSTALIELGTKGRPLHDVAGDRERRVRRVITISRALDEVAAMCATGWPVVGPSGKPSDRRIPLTVGGIDISFESDTVCTWQRTKGRGLWRLIMGVGAERAGSMWPAKTKQNRRGHHYRSVDVNQAKHVLRRCLRVPPGEPGYWAIPSSGISSNTLRAYYRHMASERYNRTLTVPRWEKITPGMANHFWDCEVYQVCLAVGMRVNLPSMPQMAVPRKSLKEWKGLRPVGG